MKGVYGFPVCGVLSHQLDFYQVRFFVIGILIFSNPISSPIPTPQASGMLQQVTPGTPGISARHVTP